MEYRDILKKVEKLEHDNQVLKNRVDRQRLILDEFVALLEIHCKEDIMEIRISHDNMPPHIKSSFGILSKTKIYLRTNSVDGEGTLNSNATFGDVLGILNAITPCRFSINKRYLNLPVGKLPNIDRKNLYTNNCLVIIKL